MRGQNTWSYHPYRPLLIDVGEIYICRVAPTETAIHLEWLSEKTDFSVFYRTRGAERFIRFCDTQEHACDITGLAPETEYEFFVSSGEAKSRVRLARCGKSVGTTVNYLHPEDEAYAFSGRYLCSPSLLRHPDGYLLASMDLFEGEEAQNLTLIFRSDDDGATWHYVSELMPCFWGKLFLHRGELYMLACSTEYGDLLIGKSLDGGKTFGAPVALLRGGGGKNGQIGVHKNPQNMICHGGRLYGTLEWGSWKNREFGHAAMVMSCDENADLLIPENWHFSAPLKFDHFLPELADLPQKTMTIEGTLAVSPEGKLLNIMRFGRYNTAIAYEVNTADPDAPLRFAHLIPFSANYSKFTVKKDPVTGYYYTVGTRVYSPDNLRARNLLSLMRSQNLQEWEVVTDLLDYRHADSALVGFQYVDFEIEGEDLIFLSRTAINGAHNFHDANYSTFHRVKNFRTAPLLT
ncbi:MAG: hypothetical protein IJW51_06500 [Clostridia bacterium]|nr:hypothetical protein [Clostridia bacterium]